MQGVEHRDNNGIHIVRLHYTADPAKRSEEWRQEAKRGLSRREWEREYEINWHIASGLSVYADEFVRDWHVAGERIRWNLERPVYRGWDFGLTPACCWAQMGADGRLYVLLELNTWNGRGDMKQMGIEQFTPLVVQLSNQEFYEAEFIDYADPAGWSKAQTDEKTCVGIMNTQHIYPRPGPVTFTDRRRAVTERLTTAVSGGPAIVFDPRCTMLIEGFEGAYRFEQIGETGRYKETVEKNAWSHIVNALEYLVGGIYGTRPGRREHKPKQKRRDPVTGY